MKTEEEIKERIIELYKKRQIVGHLKDTEFGFLEGLEWVLGGLNERSRKDV